MSLWDRVAAMVALAPWDHPPIQLSTDTENIDQQLARIDRQAAARPWRVASIDEALGVPAISGAVTLVSNVSGTMTARVFRNNVPLPDGERPRVAVRPNPFGTPRLFFHQTVFSMAARGEAWLWAASRDGYGYATSLVPVPAYEVMVEAPTGDWLRPEIRWRGKLMPRGDMIHIPFSLEPGALRGKGPLQMCGAAVSVAVESQEWAANFFADGGHPSIHLHSDIELTGDEAADLRTQWTETPPNMPQVTSGPMSLTELGVNVPAAQMLEARNRTAGDVAQMFHIPGSLLEYAREGSSLTYQNVSDEFDKLLRQCLLPDYLEPIEQAISDQLPRATAARFNTDALLRADVKTRYEVYQIAVDSGIMTVEEARAKEGLGRGDIETAPVPPSPPQAFPSQTPRLSAFRCPSCSRKLAESAGPGTRIACRCGTLAAA